MSKLIPLTQEQFSIVDNADFDWLSQWKWHYVAKDGSQYASRTSQGIKMHRVILNAPTGIYVDHIDGNGLNNQRSNLRFATPQQNMHNQRPQQRENKTSPYKGVALNYKKWRAHIRVNGKLIVIGRFDFELDAARAYDAAARQFFGEFARPNFPEE